MKFDQALLERIRASANIVDIVGGYVQLRRQGHNWVALCPFHREKTPSFNVSETRQLFKCFGCGVGGDVFSFIEQIERVGFSEAVKIVADRAGIRLPAGGTQPAQAQLTVLRQIVEQAAAFFRSQLEASESAQSYLSQRGITAETITHFGLGYAPPGNRLLAYFSGSGVRPEQLEACGLVARRDQGGWYDKFRDRIMMPIADPSGRIVAFGGRLMGDGQPKYLNSPETPLFHKGSLLFGLSATRDEIRRSRFAILVEGYFDALVPYQYGIRNIVACLGTSLTEDQARLLARYCQKVVINFDPDSAGVNAALRAVEIFLKQDFEVSVLRLPEREDPDSFLRKQGAEAYREALRQSLPWFDFVLEHLLAGKAKPLTPASKQEVVDRILPFLASVPGRIERAEWAAHLAARLAIPESLIIGELRRTTGLRSRGDKLEATDASGTVQEAESVVTLQDVTLAEKTLLAGLLDDALRPWTLRQVEPSLVEGLSTEPVFVAWKAAAECDEPIDLFSVRRRLSPAAADLLDRLAVETEGSAVGEEEIRGSLESLRDLQLRRLSRRIRQQIIQEERADGDQERLRELLRRQAELERLKKR